MYYRYYDDSYTGADSESGYEGWIQDPETGEWYEDPNYVPESSGTGTETTGKTGSGAKTSSENETSTKTPSSAQNGEVNGVKEGESSAVTSTIKDEKAKLPPRPADYDYYWYQDEDGNWRNEYDDYG